MVRSIVCAAVVAMAVGGRAVTRADEFGTEIDLESFGREAARPESVWDDIPLQDVARRLGTRPRDASRSRA
jgi:hypothetical protein